MSWTIRCRTSSRDSLWVGATVDREDPGDGVPSRRPGSGMGAHLHRTLKFLPSATCRRDRLLPMASTRVTMSEPKPEGGWGQHRRGCGEVVGVGIERMAGGSVWGQPHHYPTDPGSSLLQHHTPSPVSPGRPLSAAEDAKWSVLRSTGHSWGGSGSQRPHAPTSRPRSQCVGPLPAQVGSLALTSQALRSRWRSLMCVLSARPSKRALGGEVTEGSRSWERGTQGANKY